MKQIIPEVYVKNCKEALSFYAVTLGGVVKNLQMSEDMELFRDDPGKVIHSELHINKDCVIYFVDILNRERAKTGNITLMLHMDSMEEASRVYKALSKGGAVLMELQKTFWGAWHAIVTDRFGAPWSISYSERASQTA